MRHACGSPGAQRGCGVAHISTQLLRTQRPTCSLHRSVEPRRQRVRQQGQPRARRTASCCAAASSVAQEARTAVVIVDHGSRRAESNEQLERFVEMYRRSHPGQLALAAHMELAQPSIQDAVRAAAEAGCQRVIVAPYFLSYGRHIQQDIPALVAEAAAACPGVECTIADPIGAAFVLSSEVVSCDAFTCIAAERRVLAGLDEAVVGIIKSRVDSALASEPAVRQT